MKNILKYIVASLLASAYTSCFNVNKINNKIAIDKEYNGWFIGASNGIFFVLHRQGLLKRNIAFSIGSFRKDCPGRVDTLVAFFKSACEKKTATKKRILF